MDVWRFLYLPTGTWRRGGQGRKQPREVLPDQPAPNTIIVDFPLPSYKRSPRTAPWGPKILSNLTPIFTSTPYVAINHPLLTQIPQELDKLANSLAVRAREVGFFQTCTEVRRPPELDTLPVGAHPAAPLLRHEEQHGVHITLPRGMYKEERDTSIRYGMHASSSKGA